MRQPKTGKGDQAEHDCDKRRTKTFLHIDPFRSLGRGTSFHSTYSGAGGGVGWGGAGSSHHCCLSLVSRKNQVGRWVCTWFLSHIAPRKGRLLQPSNGCFRSYPLGSPRWKRTRGARGPWVSREWRPAPCPSLTGPVWCSLRTESPAPASGREVWARWPGTPWENISSADAAGWLAKGSWERFPGLSATTAILSQASQL